MMHPMPAFRILGVMANVCLAPLALLSALVECYLRPALRWLANSAVYRALGLHALHRRLGRLPPAVALLLFAMPELCSHGGWFAAAWLAMAGRAWQGVLCYGATKLLAGGVALWVYAGCEPTLLRLAWFARAHKAGATWRNRTLGGSRYAQLRARLIARLGPPHSNPPHSMRCRGASRNSSDTPATTSAISPTGNENMAHDTTSPKIAKTFAPSNATQTSSTANTINATPMTTSPGQRIYTH